MVSASTSISITASTNYAGGDTLTSMTLTSMNLAASLKSMSENEEEDDGDFQEREEIVESLPLSTQAEVPNALERKNNCKKSRQTRRKLKKKEEDRKVLDVENEKILKI